MRIAVIHPNMMSAGGAESFAMVVLETLQEKGEIDFITDGGVDFDELNKKFDNKVDAGNIRIIQPFFCSLVGWLEQEIHLFANLELALFSRYIKKHQDYDLIVSTKGEMDLGKPGIQIMPHIPNIHGRAYTWFLRRLGREKENIESNITVCHSNYIKDAYDRMYGRMNSVVIEPPIRKCPIRKEWAEREEGFVIVGRITKDKKTDKAIELIDLLRTATGKDLHLHIVGNGSGSYYRMIDKMARDREYVHLEGFVSTEKYFELLTDHKYGIHMRENEPSAVTVRELVDCGEIVFAHNSGGTPEILNYNKHLLFGKHFSGKAAQGDALYRTSKVIGDEQLQKEILNDLQKLTFNSREDWKREFRRILDKKKVIGG